MIAASRFFLLHFVLSVSACLAVLNYYQVGKKYSLPSTDGSVYAGISRDSSVILYTDYAHDIAYIYEQSTSGNPLWVVKQSIRPNDGVKHSNFGYSFDFSDDSSVIALGGTTDDDYIGAVWVFRRISSSYVQMQPKLVANDYSGKRIQQGWSIACDDACNTIVVGGPEDDDYVGATWVFIKLANGSYVQDGPKLVGMNYVGAAEQGQTVAVNYDGTFLLTTGSFDNQNTGAMWAFQKLSGSSKWVQQGEKIVPQNPVKNQQFGYSLSMNAYGNLVAIGGPTAGSSSVWIYEKNLISFTWSEKTKLVPYDWESYNDDYFGSALALARSGNVVAVGGLRADNYTGAVWIFAFNGSSWTQCCKLQATDASSQSEQGSWVSVNAYGTNLVITAQDNNRMNGAFWEYSNIPTLHPSRPPTTTKPSATPSKSPQTRYPTSSPTIPKMCQLGRKSLTAKQCANRIQNCNHYGIILKWNNVPCLVYGRKKKNKNSSGCQCDQYCGYTCSQACTQDEQCFWQNGLCYNRKFNVSGNSLHNLC